MFLSNNCELIVMLVNFQTTFSKKISHSKFIINLNKSKNNE